MVLSGVYYYWYSALGPVWAETRTQSGDWYGSGTLHPGQVLRGSLPLLSGVPRKKSPVTTPGIDPGTVRLVAQRLNQYAIPGPSAVNKSRLKEIIKHPFPYSLTIAHDFN